MTTTAPGLPKVEPQQVKPRRVSRHVSAFDAFDAFDDDPTVYPDYEPVGRDHVEHQVVRFLEPVIIRHLAQRGTPHFVGSDAFFYWVKGDNKQSVSPDIYILPGVPANSHPRKFAGSKEEACWKTWIHHVVPSFALEVKAWKNPRKDELQSPPRHDALGTKELIVFDPFHHRRRAPRKRFVVYRRDASGKLVIVQATNDDRVRSEDLDAFLVAEGEGDDALLRLALGPNGERLLPFESELVEMEARRANEAAQRAQLEARRRHEEARRADEEARLRQEEARLRQEEARRADEATRVAQEAARRTAELEAELARLRAGKRRKR